MALCNTVRASGQACKGTAMAGKSYCWAHDPQNAEARKRTASKAGKRGGRGRPAVDLGEIKTQLGDLLADVLAGDIPPGVASVAVQVQHARLRCVEVERKLQETQELMERIEALEELAGPQPQRPKVQAQQPGRSYQ
jgi:hypothetical protein